MFSLQFEGFIWIKVVLRVWTLSEEAKVRALRTQSVSMYFFKNIFLVLFDLFLLSILQNNFFAIGLQNKPLCLNL